MKIEVYRRADEKWAWRLIAGNGQVIATDGGQGYENRSEAVAMARKIVTRAHADTTFAVEP